MYIHSVKAQLSALACALVLLAGCSPAPEGDEPAALDARSPTPTQAQLERFKAEGPLPAAREASVLEFWLHYKLMQATGMEQALGGEEQAVAALRSVGKAFERSAVGVQAQTPRMIPAAFDGNGLDMGVMGAGYGLVGGAITGGMLGGLSPEQVAQAIKGGPIKLGGNDGSAEIDIAQDGMDTTLEQTVNENGVTGKVKTHIHMDACPDAQGKLEVTIETESHMGAAGKSGAVTVRYRQERWLDDDARLLPAGENNASEFFQLEMSGTGANGNLSYYTDGGTSRDGKATGGTVKESGHSIFRPDEARHTEQLMSGTQSMMRIITELMMTGGFTGGKAPWESGRCVDLKLRSSPEKRKGATPKTKYTIFAEPRAKTDGMPTGGTVKATLKGPSSLSPQDKVKADAQFEYQNPQEKDQRASIEFEARSKRGVGKATLEFDTRKGGYRIALDNGESITTCDITQPFSGKIGGGPITLKFTPDGEKSGKMAFHFANGQGVADTAYSYALSGPEESMTGTFTSESAVCGKAAGLGACGNARKQTFSSTWTRIDDCGE